MTEAHYFAAYCPFFSVKDIELYHSNFEFGAEICDAGLRSVKNLEAYRWYNNSVSRWQRFLDEARQWSAKAKNQSYKIIFWGEAEFPEKLKTISFPPAVLFVKGDFSLLARPSVAFVGARSPTQLGRLWLENVIPDVVHEGFVTVSGGARGIDADAHVETLRAGGHTVVFLPGGIDNPYPHSNHDLFREVLKCGGALVSEFPPGTKVRAEHFFRRNRLIAGLADAVVIVEAGVKSGTMLTAKSALSENREVLVVPGPPMIPSYVGSLDLLLEGATMARSAREVINAVQKKLF